jgi:hypothetical protein
MTVFVQTNPRGGGYEATVLDTRPWRTISGLHVRATPPRTVTVGTGEQVSLPAWADQHSIGPGVLVRSLSGVRVVPLNHVRAVVTDEWRAERDRKARAEADAKRIAQNQRDLARRDATAVYERARTAGYDVTLTGRNEFVVSVDTMRALLDRVEAKHDE